MAAVTKDREGVLKHLY